MGRPRASGALAWSPRTVLRIFLVLGGLAIGIWGVSTGETLNVGIGVLAIALGAFGLWYESREER